MKGTKKKIHLAYFKSYSLDFQGLQVIPNNIHDEKVTRITNVQCVQDSIYPTLRSTKNFKIPNFPSPENVMRESPKLEICDICKDYRSIYCYRNQGAHDSIYFVRYLHKH